MKTKKIKSITSVGKGNVYDISVEKYENYILENGVVTHNSGLQYASSTIVYLSKSKEKDGTEIIGNIIKATTKKSRLSKENKQVEIRLFYDERGLDKYYGLLELGEIGGLWKNVAGRYEIGGKKIYGKDILKDVDKYFTPEVMQALDETAQKEYSYGSS
jgi:intein/homing endonuclease